LNIGLHYNRFFRNAWIDQFYASAQMSGAGNIYWTETNDIKQPFYALLNMKTGVRKGIVSASLWSRNLTATDYAAFYFESRNTPFIQKGKPLQVGAEISLTF
ncbi:MAG: TonB-dependent receptor, partial [Tannerellaceae bacterium]|nr:TonB-dependent receptor [Tannerellaceae bacterium]